MSLWYKLSIVCGLAPLVTGLSILVSWLLTRAPWLAVAGIWTIYVGLVLVFFGLVFLVLHYLENRKQNKSISKKEVIAPLAVLFINFPAAIFSLSVAVDVSLSSSVTVINHGQTEVVDVVLKLPNQTILLPSVAPGKKHFEKLRFEREGSVDYSITIDGEEKSGLLIGYVTPGIGSKAFLKITESGAIEIENKF